MEISISRYELQPRYSLNAKSTERVPRPGVLIRVIEGKSVGYSNLHPLIEFGDLSVDQQLRQSTPPATLQRALWLAQQDLSEHLPSSAKTLKNNFLIPDVLNWKDVNSMELMGAGFETVKIKMGRDPEAELQALQQFANHALRLRLDFNGTQSAESFEKFLAKVPDRILEKIEYIEDPTSTVSIDWTAWNKVVPLAMDQTFTEQSPAFDLAKAQVLVVKPTRQNVEVFVDKALASGGKVTVTSSMDHPLGVLQAYGYAQRLRKQHGDLVLDSGCATLNLFSENEFQGFVREQGPYIEVSSSLENDMRQALQSRAWEKI